MHSILGLVLAAPLAAAAAALTLVVLAAAGGAFMHGLCQAPPAVLVAAFVAYMLWDAWR
jgi:hypothetical protein